MSEAKFSYTTKVNGDLFTVRGDSGPEFATNLTYVLDNADKFAEGLTALQAIGAASALVAAEPVQQFPSEPQPAPPAAAGWGAAAAPTPAAAPPAAFAAAAVPSCQHGPRTARSGNGAKGPWKSWFCSAPQGTPRDQQCPAIFVDKKDHAAWNNHPA